MDTIHKTGFMLITKSCCHKSAKYRLYFVHLPTMYTDTPRVHRLICRSRRVFAAFKTGGVYDVSYRRIKLRSYERTGDYALTDEEYEYLMDLKDYIFPDPDTLEELNLREEMPFGDKYYSLSERRKILSYSPPVLEKISITAINVAVTALSVIIPAGLFLIFLLAFADELGDITAVSSPIVFLPLILVLSLPFVVFLMNLLYIVGTNLLYTFGYTKWELIRRHVLRYGGLKKDYFINAYQRRRLIRFGVASLVFFIAAAVLGNMLY